MTEQQKIERKKSRRTGGGEQARGGGSGKGEAHVDGIPRRDAGQALLDHDGPVHGQHLLGVEGGADGHRWVRAPRLAHRHDRGAKDHATGKVLPGVHLQHQPVLPQRFRASRAQRDGGAWRKEEKKKAQHFQKVQGGARDILFSLCFVCVSHVFLLPFCSFCIFPHVALLLACVRACLNAQFFISLSICARAYVRACVCVCVHFPFACPHVRVSLQ